MAGLGLYGLLFALAPLIARFYNQPEMVWLSRFLFSGFLFGGIATAPSAYFFRNLNVKLRSRIQICAILLSGTVGVTCAAFGCGYWGIAARTVTYSGCNALLLWLRSPPHPTLSFRMAPLREMLPFSTRQLMTSLFTHINNNFFSVLLGRFYGMQPTGYYTQGSKWTTMGYSTISGCSTVWPSRCFARHPKSVSASAGCFSKCSVSPPLSAFRPCSAWQSWPEN